MELFLIRPLISLLVLVASCRTTGEKSTASGFQSSVSNQENNSLDRMQVILSYREAINPENNIYIAPGYPKDYFYSGAGYAFLGTDLTLETSAPFVCHVEEEVKDSNGKISVYIKECTRIFFESNREEELTERGYLCLQSEDFKGSCSLTSSNLDQLMLDPTISCSTEELNKPGSIDCVIKKLASFKPLIIEKNTSSDCVCGLDISSALGDVKQEVVGFFNDLGPQGQAALCPSVQSETGWDIRDLYKTEGFSKFEQSECGNHNSLCSSTVTVQGKCYFAGEVNYFLYGLINHLCWNTLRDPISQARFSQPAMNLSINLWRQKKNIASGHDVDAQERIAWAQIGWDALDHPEPSGYSTSIKNYPLASKAFPVCPHHYPTPLKWHLGKE